MKLLPALMLAFCLPATAQVFEDFEHNNLGLYTAVGSGTSTTINAASAHDGNLGLGFAAGTAPWYYRTDVLFGAGSVMRTFVRTSASDGRTYVGFSADASGCWSAIVATNSNELALQENFNYSLYTDRATTSFTFADNTWYQLEVDWAANGDVTLNLYNASGTVRLTSTPTYPTGQLAAKGFAFRGFDNTGRIDLDTLSLGVGTPPVVYCTAKTNSLGCVPTIGFSGIASATAGFGFVVKGTNVRNNKTGILLYGVTGQAATPFQGGTLCVNSQIRRTGAVHSGGTPAPASNCTGVYSIDMNAFAVSAGPPVPLPQLSTPGSVVNCQFWGRDPGFAPPNNTTLTNGLEYIVRP